MGMKSKEEGDCGGRVRRTRTEEDELGGGLRRKS